MKQVDRLFSYWVSKFNYVKMMEEKQMLVMQMNAFSTLRRYLEAWNRAYLEQMNRDVAVDRLLNRSLIRKAY